jgi:hypothetical protein
MTDWGAGLHLRHPRCKAGVHSWLNVFLDSLLSQRMTERGAYPAPSSPSPTHIVTSFEEKAQSGGPFLVDCLSGFPAFAENDGMGAYPAPSLPSPTHIVTSFEEKAQSGGPFLADCLSGFPAFAENDGMGNENDERGTYPAPSSPSPTDLCHPRPLTLVTLAAKRGSILG